MSLQHYTFTVNSVSPTLITPAGQEAGSSVTIYIQNNGVKHAVIGSVGLTTSSYGRHLNAGEDVKFENLTTSDEIYALAETGQNTTIAVTIIKR